MTTILEPSPRRWPHLVIRASAGTGKTFRLSNRFIDLLASGEKCEEILATTFTRKAAGEILDRILLRLAIAATDESKRLELASYLEQGSLSQAACLELLATTTRSLHRLRVSTLDSFFIAIATSHSLELGLPAGWSIVDEVTDVSLRDKAIAAAIEQDATHHLVTLVHLLTKGETTRSIARVLRETVQSLYGLYLETTPEAWQRLELRKGLEQKDVESTIAAIETLTFKDNRCFKARDSDLTKALAGDWEGFISAGLANKVLHNAEKYYSQPLTTEITAPYERLLDHARAMLVNPIVHHNAGTFQFLQKFDREYQRLKQEQRVLRFDDVTRLVANSPAVTAIDRLGFRLDGGIQHLLLDEFQDTSLSQWQVLRPFARSITSSDRQSSFFCVGDVKQAIYGWRGGLAQLFDSLPEELTGLVGEDLVQSFRSSPPVIETVNVLFQKLQQHTNLDDYADIVTRWQERFATHDTARGNLPGYACLRTLPEIPDDANEDEFRDAFIADYVRQLMADSPGMEIGILVKTNDAVRRTIFALRAIGIDASEEGGNPLSDSAAVELILSLLQLADHPGDSAARFHVAKSHLGQQLGYANYRDDDDTVRLAANIRRELQEQGYGPCVLKWAKLLGPHGSRRELSRLDQLVELAYRYDPKGSLRTSDFVTLVAHQKVSDPTTAPVRVMTVHQSKGLQFDIVVLPELDARLIGQPEAFVTGRSSPTAPIEAVCRYVSKDLRAFLPPDFQRMFEQATAQRLSEMLCVLYVAVTRAVYALHMLVDAAPASSPKPAKSFAGLLRAALCNNQPVPANALGYTCGDEQWFEKLSPRPTAPAPLPPTEPLTITLAPSSAVRQRGWQAISPSQLEGQETQRIENLFREDRAFEKQLGTLMHAWLATITWLEQGVLNDAALRRIAIDEVGWQHHDLDKHLAKFRHFLAQPALIALLASAKQPKLASGLHREVRHEHPFALREAGQLFTGSIDRIILTWEGERVVAAEIIDFKTDSIPADALSNRTTYYRPQMVAYQQAVQKLYRLAASAVTARLVFLEVGQIRDV
ncbi:MAG TPA: UvrD-helicase domain-containing protein [Pirellulaceae bacterium]|nr:UvrD-helicase domain-containing protein [Pirellulaceae bacterium]